MHICQLSRIIQESPGYSTHLPLSHTGHQISRNKSTGEYFCALLWTLAHFFFSGAFSQVFSTKAISSLQWLMQILMVCTSCKSSYNVLNHFPDSWVNLWGGVWVGFCGHLGRGLVQEIESPDFRSPEVGISGNVKLLVLFAMYKIIIMMICIHHSQAKWWI